MAEEKKHWMQAARERMKKKGTEGKFGKATEKKIAAGKRAGGVREKEAVFAENMKHIAEHHHSEAEHHRRMAAEHERMAKRHEGHKAHK
jgi:hypothetical protein